MRFSCGIFFVRRVFMNKRWAIGIGLLVLVAIIWVSASTLVQFILKSQSFSQPFFLTYFSTSLFSLYLLGFIIFPQWRGSVSWEPVQLVHEPVPQSEPPADTNPEENILANSTSENQENVVLLNTENKDQLSGQEEGIPVARAHFTVKETALISIMFCPIWFIANYGTFHEIFLRKTVSLNFLKHLM